MAPRAASTVMQHVGRRVAELRRARGFTQEAFAERIAVSVGYVRQVEGGQENLTILTLAKLADALGADVADLFVPAPTTAKKGRPRKAP